MINSRPVSSEDEVAALNDKSVEATFFDWQRWAMPKQLPPEGDWTTWLLLGGRGSGKTRAGAEWVRQLARDNVSPIALVGETMTEALDIMVRGESGLLAIHPDHERPRLKGKNRLCWPNGVEATLLTASDPERFRGPQFAAAWCDELGCGAVDKGSNQPNIFGDSKSGESGRPYFSAGTPDALTQRQFLRAHVRHWQDTAHNPPGMVDPERIYCWTWDARPFPSFPALEDVWADGPNHRTGHWLTGRLGGLASDELIGAIAGDHAVTVAASPAAPLIGGLLLNGPGSVRDGIEPVLELTGQKLLARDGEIVGLVAGDEAAVDADQLAVLDGPVLTRRRSAAGEVPARLALSHFDRERDYLTASATALRPGNGPLATQSLLVVLDGAAARMGAERFLDAQAASGDRIELALPPSCIALEPGDRIAISGLAEGPFEITEIRDGAVRRIAAVAVGRREAVAVGAEPARGASGGATASVAPLVIAAHLPATPQDPIRTRLVLGAYARPWPGRVRIVDDVTGAPVAELTRAAATGVVVTGVPAGPVAVWDHGSTLDVTLRSGHLADVEPASVLGGSNRLAVQTAVGWEILGFAEAQLLAPRQYRLTSLLRGLGGTEPGDILTGGQVLVLDRSVASLPIDQHRIGETRTLRIETTDRQGHLDVVLDPYPALPLAPVHLSAVRQENGDVVIAWVRRSRAEGDGWGVTEPPLEYGSEAWRVEIFDGANQVRSLESAGTTVVYTAADQLADFSDLPETFDFSVSQISAAFGPGHDARGTFDD